MTSFALTTLLAAGEPAGGAPVQDLVPAALVGGRADRRRARGRRSATAPGASRCSAAPPALAERVMPGARLGGAAGAGHARLARASPRFGFFWDVATHIDDGRDAGPFANVAHYPILLGLGGVALAGFLAAVLGADARDRAAITLGARLARSRSAARCCCCAAASR